jgi:hypothetical protein
MKGALVIVGVLLLLLAGLAPLDAHAFQGTLGSKWTNGGGKPEVWPGHKGRWCEGRWVRGCWRR